MKNLYYQLVLSSPRILKLYLEEGGDLDIALVKLVAFLEARKLRGWQYPDHYYKNYLSDSIGELENVNDLLTKSLEKLSLHFLEFRDKRIYVKNNLFSEYQALLCDISPVTLIAAAVRYSAQFKFYSDVQILEVFKENLSCSALIYPYTPLLEKLKQDYGLLDLHMHLNGTVEFDVLWQHILEKPNLFYSDIKYAQNNSIVNELYSQIDEDIKEEDLRKFLYSARELRRLLIVWGTDEKDKGPLSFASFRNIIKDGEYYGNSLSDSLYSLKSIYEDVLDSTEFEIKSELRECSALAREAFFIYKALGMASKNRLAAQSLHSYILILSLLNSYSVQQVNQLGFDQFQKFTQTEHRSIIESKSYLQRYEQLSGAHENTLANLEGRFSFRNNAIDQFKLLSLIVYDYERYLLKVAKELRKVGYSCRNSLKEGATLKCMLLQLVAHFIKQPDNSLEQDSLYDCRQKNNRKRYKRQAEIMVFLLNEIPKLKMYVTGFDAANNEQYTPPEVFAPVYRYLKYHGYSHFTFHCGEDYVHLISGIRAIYEAVEYLDLGAHNRIGHGTAIGICPELWLRRVDKEIAISKGEWLDNLIFCYKILKDSPNYHTLIANIIFDIEKLCDEIYEDTFSLSRLITSWELRHLDALLLPRNENDLNYFDDTIGCDFLELELIGKAQKNSSGAYELLERYHSQKVYEASNHIIYVNSDYLPAEVLYYLQEEMLKILNRKGIAIESLPTSNVRISFYKNHYEHHIYRWLTGRWKNHYGTKPLIVLGSDDAGIFATNVQNEYSHVFEILKHHNVDECDIVDYLEAIRENSKALRFF